MSEHARTSPTWLLSSMMVIAVATEAVLVGALAASDEGGVARSVVFGASIAILALVIAGAVWAAGMRRAAPDPLLERAETASKIAHELKNPLASIKGLASTGVKLFDSMSDAERLEFFRLIDEEASRLKLAIEQSLPWRFNRGGGRVLRPATDRHRALVEELAWRAPYGEHPMVVETEPGLECPDRAPISEVIHNLLDNAAKFSPPDARSRSASFEERTARPSWRSPTAVQVSLPSITRRCSNASLPGARPL